MCVKFLMTINVTFLDPKSFICMYVSKKFGPKQDKKFQQHLHYKKLCIFLRKKIVVWERWQCTKQHYMQTCGGLYTAPHLLVDSVMHFWYDLCQNWRSLVESVDFQSVCKEIAELCRLQQSRRGVN